MLVWLGARVCVCVHIAHMLLQCVNLLGILSSEWKPKENVRLYCAPAMLWPVGCIQKVVSNVVVSQINLSCPHTLTGRHKNCAGTQ